MDKGLEKKASKKEGQEALIIEIAIMKHPWFDQKSFVKGISLAVLQLSQVHKNFAQQQVVLFCFIKESCDLLKY